MQPILLEQISFKPVSGRVMARKTQGDTEALVGVLHFPEEFRPKEGGSYIAACAGGNLYIIASVVDADLPEEAQGYGMDGALRGNCWRKTGQPGTLTVRFVEAFPESNGWAIYGASNQPLFPPDQYQRGHAFLEVKEGALHSLPAAEGVHGITPAQLLNTLPLWPDATGVLHTVPTMEARWRQAYHDHSVLQAKYGAGELTKEEFHQAVAVDPKIDRIKSYRLDEEYCRYLAAMKDAGALDLPRPMTIDDIATRDALAQSILKNIVVEQRMNEMKGLATSLKL